MEEGGWGELRPLPHHLAVLAAVHDPPVLHRLVVVLAEGELLEAVPIDPTMLLGARELCPDLRGVEDLVQALGCEGISKSQVSRICQELDGVVESFLGRPLDGGPYPYLWLDALTQKVREDGRIVNVSVAVATGVNREGKREVLGIDVGTSEDDAFWLAFLRSLAARGLGGVELVTSDAHRGLKDAIATMFAGASWQRCRTHFMTNLLSRVPRRAQPWVATMVRTIYQQPSPEEVHAQHARMVGMLDERFPQAAELLADVGPDILAFTAFPVAHWQQVWSNNPQERLNKEIRRRTDVVGIFPNRPASAPKFANAGADAWPGERVSRERDTWVRPPTWLSPVRSPPNLPCQPGQVPVD